MSGAHRNLTASQALYARARSIVPAGVSSNTRARAPHPLYFSRARGHEIWDADGNRWLDIVMGNGAILLGHAHGEVQEAVAEALASGLTIGQEWERAVEVAELFRACAPMMEMVRFTNTGTEAVLHALHVARAATGRRRIAKPEGSYHGWSDEAFVSVWANLERAGPIDAIRPLPGMPGLREDITGSVVVLPFNDIANTRAAIERAAGEIAAVIIEPAMVNIGFIAPTKEYLSALRAICDAHGIVLIFDELLTGLNLAPGGAMQRYGVTPDLATFGKAIANGYPMAALAGRADLMALTEPGKGPAFVGTFNGHPVPLAAARAVLPLLATGAAQRAVEARNRQLCEAFDAQARALGVPARACGQGSHFHWYFTDTAVRDYRTAATTSAAAYAAFTGALFQRGILFLANPLSHHALSLAHGEETLDELAAAFRAGLAAVRETPRETLRVP